MIIPPVKGPAGVLISRIGVNDDNMVWRVVLKRWLHNLHGIPNVVLCGALFLAIISAALQPSGDISFPIWYAILSVYLVMPGVMFTWRVRRNKDSGHDLLLSQQTSYDFIDALKSAYFLSAAYAAIPYLVYWIVLLTLRATVYPYTLRGYAVGHLLLSASLFFLILWSLIWLCYWCVVSQSLRTVVAAAVFMVVVVMTYVGHSDYLMGIQPWPVDWPLWVMVLVMSAAGTIVRRMLSKSYLDRIRTAGPGIP